MAALLEDMQKATPGLEHGFEALSPKEYEQRKVDMYNASVGELDKEDGYTCEACHNKGSIAVLIYNEMYGYWAEALRPCKCQKVRSAIRRLERSGLKDAVKKYSFDMYEAKEPWQAGMKEAAVRFCSDPERRWFFIGGQSGAGKTHLCTAIAVQLLRQGQAVRYMLWRDEITFLKAQITDAEVYETAIKELKETDVLYIDDLFKTGKDELGRPKAPTAADVNAAFEILNYRYNNPSLTTIISTERTISELADIDEAIAGRIAELSKRGGYCINIKHDSTRNYRLNGITEL